MKLKDFFPPLLVDLNLSFPCPCVSSVAGLRKEPTALLEDVCTKYLINFEILFAHGNFFVFMDGLRDLVVNCMWKFLVIRRKSEKKIEKVEL